MRASEVSLLTASVSEPKGRRTDRRFRGDRTACPPPVTGRSASFRLRFRFVRVVRAVRAGEAKLRGRMQTVVLIAGPPGCEYPGFARGFSLSFCAQVHGF